jgi:hypothetical protein
MDSLKVGVGQGCKMNAVMIDSETGNLLCLLGWLAGNVGVCRVTGINELGSKFSTTVPLGCNGTGLLSIVMRWLSGVFFSEIGSEIGVYMEASLKLKDTGGWYEICIRCLAMAVAI